MRRKYDPAFADARGMSPGGIITYDPSKEGTGEKKDGVIKEISRSFLSLVLEDGTAIGATRVYAYRPPRRDDIATIRIGPAADQALVYPFRRG